MHTALFFNSTLSDSDIRMLSGTKPLLHIQPDCRCPPSHPNATDTFCLDTLGSSSLPRVNTASHDISFINDNDATTFWQSSLGDSVVNVTFDLQGLREVLYLSAHFVSAVPSAMVLLYSTDGQVFSPRQYYARNCSQFGLEANTILTTSTGVNCLSTHILQYPFSNEHLEFLLLGSSYRPNSGSTLQYNLQTALQQFAQATHVRLQLFGWHPEQSAEQRFFSIDEVVMLGRACVCNGHGSSCEDRVCVCQHNTQGEHCEQCQPLYNNSPWQAGTVSHANECSKCQCNNHSSQCYYNNTVGSGVCVDCRDNTTGPSCDQCLPFFYHIPSERFSSPSSCQPCNCHSAGITNKGDCLRGDGSDGSDSGQCSCKLFTSGRDCSQCKAGFFNLTADNPDGCSPCSCNTTGTVDASVTCRHTDGQCSCLPQVIGRNCSTCAPGHYGFGEAEGCLACDPECVECTGPNPTQCLVSFILTLHDI